MARRRGWKRGDWLVRDEESGLVEYASNVTRDFYGVLKRKDQAARQHPQDFVKAGNDPYINDPQASPAYTYDTSAYNVSAFVYGTNIPTPRGPAFHLFGIVVPGVSVGVGSWSIGTTFTVT